MPMDFLVSLVVQAARFSDHRQLMRRELSPLFMKRADFPVAIPKTNIKARTRFW